MILELTPNQLIYSEKKCFSFSLGLYKIFCSFEASIIIAIYAKEKYN